MNCSRCDKTDGLVYTSVPPKLRCTITGKFHVGTDDCDVEFVPVVRCGQCHHYRPHDGWCSVWGSHIASEDYYCADGFPKVGDKRWA